MTVVEVWPGEGWYTEVIAPLMREKGKYYAATFAADPASEYLTNMMKAYRAEARRAPRAVRPRRDHHAVRGRWRHRAARHGRHGRHVPQPPQLDEPGLGAAGVRARCTRRSSRAECSAWSSIAATSKVPQDPQAKSGYVNEDYAIELIEAQGFRLVAKSEINANPKDTKDYEQGVWTLPPTYRLGDQDRAKYAAIGESDRFTLKFVKPDEALAHARAVTRLTTSP